MGGIGTRRTYRSLVRMKRLVEFDVTVQETDLKVYALSDLRRLVKEYVIRYRRHLENYIDLHPGFVKSLVPLAVDPPAPAIVIGMAEAGRAAGVGPMASVAGALAEFVGRAILRDPAGSAEIIIENGGDIFLKTERPVTVGIFAGRSPLSLKLGLRIDSSERPMAVCTSSGTIGHSRSFGKADAACVVSPSCLLADAVATALGNRVRVSKDIEAAISWGKEIPGVEGLVLIKDDKVGLWGRMEVVPLDGKNG